MVADMDISIQFYSRLGLQLKNRWENYYAMMTAPGITLGLHPAKEKSERSGNVSIGFMIHSMEETRKLLESNHITFFTDDGKSGKYLYFKDPEGTLLYFVQQGWS